MTVEGFEFLKYAREAVRNAVDTLTEPDEDVFPVLLSHGPRGLSVMGVEMPGDELSKDQMARIMMAQIACSEAEEAAFVCTAWVRLSTEMEQQKERVILIHATRDGEKMYSAKIYRHTNRPPDLGLWESDDSDSNLGGRFGHALHMGMVMAGTLRQIPGLGEIIDRGWKEDRVEQVVQTFLKSLDNFMKEEVENGSSETPLGSE